jgi:hypothetical protein
MDLIKKAWQGEERLWIVFWIYGTLITIAMYPINKFMEHAIKPGMGGIPLLLIFILLAIELTCEVWLLVATWRCAFNVKWQGWGNIVRILCVLSGIRIGFAIIAMVTAVFAGVANVALGVTPGTIKKEHVIIQNCSEIVAEYAQKNGVGVEQYNKEHPDMIANLMEMGKCTKP